MTICSLEAHTIWHPAYIIMHPDCGFYCRGIIACGQPITVLTRVCVRINFEGLGTFRIQNQPAVAGSEEVSIEVLDGGAVRVAEVLTASGDLVSCIGDVS